MNDKMPLAWHESTLATYRDNYKREKAMLERKFADLARWEADILVWEMQLEEAKARGLDGFDRERFLKSQVKRVRTQASRDGDKHE